MKLATKKRLITNADDFGWSRGITDGILLAHRDGVITSTTLMANKPASEYALEQAAKFPKLGIGVHLHLCDGGPVLPPREVPSLVNTEGQFYPIGELRRRLWRGKLRRAEIEAEFRAQIRWVKDRGVAPDHADSHHHVHLHPFVADSFRRALLAEGILRSRPASQACLSRNGTIAGAYSGPLYRRLLLKSYMSALTHTALRSLQTPDFRLAAHPRYRGKLESLGEAWKKATEDMPPGSFELECHPGLSEAGFSETDRWRSRREMELRLLTDPDFRRSIEENGIELINYSELHGSTSRPG